jgi:hypothetical protein
MTEHEHNRPDEPERDADTSGEQPPDPTQDKPMIETEEEENSGDGPDENGDGPDETPQEELHAMESEED